MQGRLHGSTMAEELSGVLTWIKDALNRLMRMNILDCTRAGRARVKLAYELGHGSSSSVDGVGWWPLACSSLSSLRVALR